MLKNLKYFATPRHHNLNLSDRVAFNEWHPEVTDDIRLRLAKGTRYARYQDRSLDSKDYLDADGYDVSYRTVFEYLLAQFCPAFAVEHFVKDTGIRSPRILEVGSWPMKSTIVIPQFNTTLIAILAQNKEYVVAGIDSIDVDTAFPYNAWTPPHTGDSKLFYADINKESAQAKIQEYLEGKPQIIVGNMVFERRLGAWIREEEAAKRRSRTGMNISIQEEYSYPEVAEELSATCNNFLAPKGVLFVCNSNYGEMPDFIKRMPLVRVYENEKGKDFIQVRRKI